MSEQDDQLLIEFLEQRGHSEDEIQRIVKRLAEHDAASMRQSVFDSIAGGTFDLDKIIEQALGDE